MQLLDNKALAFARLQKDDGCFDLPFCTINLIQ
jgi:hypothetical protein